MSSDELDRKWLCIALFFSSKLRHFPEGRFWGVFLAVALSQTASQICPQPQENYSFCKGNARGFSNQSSAVRVQSLV